MRLFVPLRGVEVHQAAVREDFPLVCRQVLEVEMDVLDSIGTDHLGIDFLLAGKDGLADARNIDEIAGYIFKGVSFEIVKGTMPQLMQLLR